MPAETGAAGLGAADPLVPGARFLPGQQMLEGYGHGGFRFAGMSHRGSLIFLPTGVHAWPVAAPEDITAPSLAPLFAAREVVELLVIGTGATWSDPPDAALAALREAGFRLEWQDTPAAARLYHVLAREARRVAAALLAVP